MQIPSQCLGHAIFWEPPSRASLGKHSRNMCNVPINDDHMSLYCGGIAVIKVNSIPNRYINNHFKIRSSTMR